MGASPQLGSTGVLTAHRDPEKTIVTHDLRSVRQRSRFVEHINRVTVRSSSIASIRRRAQRARPIFATGATALRVVARLQRALGSADFEDRRSGARAPERFACGQPRLSAPARATLRASVRRKRAQNRQFRPKAPSFIFPRHFSNTSRPLTDRPALGDLAGSRSDSAPSMRVVRDRAGEDWPEWASSRWRRSTSPTNTFSIFFAPSRNPRVLPRPRTQARSVAPSKASLPVSPVRRQ